MLRQLNLRTIVLPLFFSIPMGTWGSGFEDTYVIGDSLSDQGNLFAITEGATGVGVPWDEQYFNGRFSNGEIYAGVLAEKIEASLGPSLTGGNNFASGGARTDYNIVEADATKPCPVAELNHGGTLDKDLFPWTINAQAQSLTDQVNKRGLNDPDALCVVFAGSNDMVDLTRIVALQIDPQTCGGLPLNKFIGERIGIVVEGIYNGIEACVTAGARHVLVPNVPNLGVVPGIARFGVNFAGLATLLSTQYNTTLDAMLASWEGRVNIIPFDFFILTTAVVSDPQKFGFSNATEPCYSGFVEPRSPDSFTVCDDPDTHVFWDFEHPTTAFHIFMAHQMTGAIVLDILDDLIRRVDDLDVKERIKNRLSRKLSRAKSKLARNKVDDASDKLDDFIDKVEKKRGNKIAEDDAEALIDGAEKVLSLLDD